MQKGKIATLKSMQTMIGLRNTLFKLRILIPADIAGGDLEYALAEIEFATKMELNNDV